VARATVRQRFRNDGDGWVEGVYVFPLPEGAAVDHLRMKVGERIIEGQIREREKARAEYERAKEQGHRASLVEQERPNIFTSRVANLGPGEELEVEIEFQQTLAFDEGEVRLRFPLVVGPRYIPGRGLAASSAGMGQSPDTDAVHDASRITPPVEGPPLRNPVTILVELDAGFPVDEVKSRYHEAVTESPDTTRHRVRLRDEDVPADRDFELTWKALPDTMPRSALYKEVKDGATYGLLTLFPPSGAGADQSRLSREIVFVIDTSGSMEGASIQQARKALLLAIGRLRNGDRFNVIQFNSATSQLFPEARVATRASRSEAIAYVRKLVANGGTEMEGALRAALDGHEDREVVRQVVFLTDGSVGNEAQLFELIQKRLGNTRLFTVGIGSAPNGHFMAKAAQLGRGTFTYIGNLDEVEERMGRLFTALESPVLTDIEVRWPSSASVEVWPARMPDLYAGEPLVLSARLTDMTGDVLATGRRGSDSWQATFPLDEGKPSVGMATLWARRKIEALLDSRQDGASPEEVRAAVVALGLAHHLVTKFTSLVAIDVTPARPAGDVLASHAVPTLLPAGWSGEAVGQLPQTATSAPLHLALMAAALSLALLLWRSGRSTRPARPS